MRGRHVVELGDRQEAASLAAEDRRRARKDVAAPTPARDLRLDILPLRVAHDNDGAAAGVGHGHAQFPDDERGLVSPPEDEVVAALHHVACALLQCSELPLDVFYDEPEQHAHEDEPHPRHDGGDGARRGARHVRVRARIEGEGLEGTNKGEVSGLRAAVRRERTHASHSPVSRLYSHTAASSSFTSPCRHWKRCAWCRMIAPGGGEWAERAAVATWRPRAGAYRR